jgi:DNA-binding transcriptional regulator LsrR (DeoR family)
MFDQITLALVGIGALEPSVLLTRSGNVFANQELDTLRHHGAVGDISLRFFDLEGKPVITPLDDRVISIRLDQLKKVRRSVGIAGGQRKHLAIKSALLGGWINVLITDRFTAEYLISADANKETGIDDKPTSPFPTHD